MTDDRADESLEYYVRGRPTDRGERTTQRDDEDFQWHVLSECADEDACPIHGLNQATQRDELRERLRQTLEELERLRSVRRAWREQVDRAEAAEAKLAEVAEHAERLKAWCDDPDASATVVGSIYIDIIHVLDGGGQTRTEAILTKACHRHRPVEDNHPRGPLCAACRTEYPCADARILSGMEDT